MAPIRSNTSGNFFDLLSIYALLGGVASLAIFFAHGAIFLELRTEGDIRDKAREIAAKAAPVATAARDGDFMAWTLGPPGPAGGRLAGGLGWRSR